MKEITITLWIEITIKAHQWIEMIIGTMIIKTIITGIIISEMNAMKAVPRTPTVSIASVNVGMDLSKSLEDVKVIGEMIWGHNSNSTDQTHLTLSNHVTLLWTARTWT